MRAPPFTLAAAAAVLAACSGDVTGPASTPPAQWFAGTYELQAIESEARPTEPGLLPADGHLRGAACSGYPTSAYDGTCRVRVVSGTLRLMPSSATAGTVRIETRYFHPEEEANPKVTAIEHPYTTAGSGPDGPQQSVFLSLPSPGQMCTIVCGAIRISVRVSGTTAELHFGFLWPERWRYAR